MNVPSNRDSAAALNADAERADSFPVADPSPPERRGPSNTKDTISDPSVVEFMDPQLSTIQPGGGVVMSIELAWGRLRRHLLRQTYPGFVLRMQATRQGHRGSLPLDPVDSRDMKYYRNQDSYWWADADDPFSWRDSLPFVRAGLAELLLIGGGFLLLGAVLALVWWPLALPCLVLSGLTAWFFRNPNRQVPSDNFCVVSPADGKLVQIDRVEDPELGPCVQFGIFLSIFNVHANRASLPGRVLAIRYQRGKFLNALKPESARENEHLDLLVQPSQATDRPFRMRQITGQFARRIVCWSRVGDILERGEMFGMIKLGSRTELLIPQDESLEIKAQLGDKLSAGSTILARYRPLRSSS
ncbi:MAG: phosphatidylserine decarboxylase [Planctomycetota bacterium]